MTDHTIQDITVPSGQDEAPALDEQVKNSDKEKDKAEKQKEETKVVPFFKLFSFADKWDYILMIVGTIGAVGNGVSMPLMTLIFGDLVNAFGQNQSDLSELVRAVSEVHFSFTHFQGVEVAIKSRER